MSTLDASVLIAHLRSADTHHQAATDYLAASGEETHWVNPITLAEILVGPTRVGRQDEVLTVLGAIGVQEVPFPEDAAARLAGLRVSTGLKLPDCCVLLTAEQTGSAVASFDDRLREAAAHRAIPVHP